ncbi:MAG: deoxyribose-phosphate aldolase [Actinomycetes bacterium]
MNIAHTIDHTLLAPEATTEQIDNLCDEARHYKFYSVCILPRWIEHAKKRLGGSKVKVVTVISFPHGNDLSTSKALASQQAKNVGADEIDMVIDRGAFLAGNYGLVNEQIVAVKAACGTAHLKVILETGELRTLDNVRRASWLAMMAGADFIKTSTGKVPVAATPPVTIVMLQAVRDYYALTGTRIGVKPAGGIRTSKDAIKYLVLIKETAGEAWLTPDLFRFGASTLLNDLLLQRQRMATGHYSGPDYVTID